MKTFDATWIYVSALHVDSTGRDWIIERNRNTDRLRYRRVNRNGRDVVRYAAPR